MLQLVPFQCYHQPLLAMAWCLKTVLRPPIWPWIQMPWGPLGVRAAGSWQVSSYGRLQRQNGTLTWGSRHPSGYFLASIGGKQWFVHRLVMHAFRCPPGNQLAWQVNHIDGNKSNNRLENLQYATPMQNIHHAFNKLPRSCGGVRHSIPVSCRAVTSKSWTYYASVSEAAKALGISACSVSKSCARRTAVKGYHCQLVAAEDSQLEAEEWRHVMDPKSGCPVPGRMVSSLGRLESRTAKIFTGYRREDGYCQTTLRTNSQAQTVLIHQLVARAFLGPPPSPRHTQVNHKDGNRSNNSAGNLEYVTPAQNILHSYRTSPTRTWTHVKPVESRLYGSNNQWRRHRSITLAARELRVNSGNIHHCLTGRSTQTGGYELRLVPPSPDLPGEEWRHVDLPSLLAESTWRTSLGQS